MPIDYAIADQVAELSFKCLDSPKAKLSFPEHGKLSDHLNGLLSQQPADNPAFTHIHMPLLASAGIEMWHRAIHSFLWSVALTDNSPIWASVSGYYSSHYVMRAFAHSMGIFKLFRQGTGIQIVSENKGWVCLRLDAGREHAFYWKVAKEHPLLAKNPLFRENHEKEDKPVDKSDAIHRNFANYADHIANFKTIKMCSLDEVIKRVQQISRVHRYGNPEAPAPQRKKFPDILTVQILAFQRIVTFREIFDKKYPKNRFWKTHRNPLWCEKIMSFDIADDGAIDGINEKLKPELDLLSLQ